jgi:hypothetical protein
MTLIAAVFLTARCATIAHGRFQQVPVTSDPAGASVAVDCGDAAKDGGVTPTTIKVRRNAASCAITLTKPGLTPQTLTLQRVTTGWFWANAAFPGLVAEVGVEAATGPPIIVFEDQVSDKKQVNVVGFVLGTGIGMLIDHATGAQYVWVPSKVDIKLH